eukprot:2837453-Ditylum_brightwellii.AAC.1
MQNSSKANQLDNTPRLPGAEQPPKEKIFKTTINTLKIKITFKVPTNADVKLRDKFATVFSVINRQYQDTALEQWDA